MELDVTQTAAATVPFVTAAIQSYGVMTLEKLRDGVIDSASNMSADWGRRLLARLLGSTHAQAKIEDAIQEVIATPQDEDAVAALRLQIRNLLLADPSLHADILSMITKAHETTNLQNFSDFSVTQNSVSFDNSRQAVLGSGIQNIDFRP